MNPEVFEGLLQADVKSAATTWMLNSPGERSYTVNTKYNTLTLFKEEFGKYLEVGTILFGENNTTTASGVGLSIAVCLSQGREITF